MRAVMKQYLWATVILGIGMGCRHPLGPDDVDNSVPRPTSLNEPAGMTVVANRGFNNLEEDNWIYGGNNTAYKRLDDQGAPQSAPAIGHITVPAGFASGGSPIHFERNIKPSDHVYVHFWFRVSDNWENNPVYDALFAFWASDQPRLYWGWRPDSTGEAMHPAAMVSTQLVEGGSLWLDANIAPTVKVARGSWHNVELDIEARTGNTGRLVAWMDGQKIAEYTNVPYGIIEQNKHWAMMEAGPAWGGLTSTPLQQTQTLDFDHIYASDRPL